MELKELNKAVAMYVEHALVRQENQEHIMALAVDKSNIDEEFNGLARVIVKREGDVNVAGYIDRSQLYHVKSEDGLKWEQVKKLEIKGIDEIIAKYKTEDSDFIGLEDPDILNENGKKHVYFTMPYIGHGLYLGHAEGRTLEDLTATDPVLKPRFDFGISGFKEVAVSPFVYNGQRINLTEAGYGDNSVITSVRATDMGKAWEYTEIVLHPKNVGYDWCAEHLSPCTFLPNEFIDLGDSLVGIVNGREKSIVEGEKTIYRKFRPGLILFDYKTGKIPWISSEPLFEDPDATTITFASDFLMKNKDEGILYAHVDDSFVRAYRIDGKALKEFLP